MKRTRSINIIFIILLAFGGYSCSNKTPEAVPDVQQETMGAPHETSPNNDIQESTDTKDEADMARKTIQFSGVNTDWKYNDEVMIEAGTPYPVDKIEEIIKTSGNDRPPIHLQYKLKNQRNIYELDGYLNKMAPKVTTLEILFPPELIKDIKPSMKINFHMPDGIDTRFILTGMGDAPLDMSKTTFSIKADTLVIRNFKFDKQGHQNALELDVGKLFIGENISFSGNKYKQQVAFMAKPLVILKSHAKEGEYSQYILKNVSFIGNATSLLAIDEDSRGKFDNIELDHVTAKDNTGGGILISATNEVYVHDSELTGSKVAPLLVQSIPDPQVKIKDSVVSDQVYGYRPIKEYWDTEAKPVIKENLTEAEGTTYDKVP